MTLALRAGPRVSLTIKLLVITEVLLLVSIVAMLLPAREQMAAQATEDLQRQLMSIAGTASLLLVGDEIQSVRSMEDVSRAEFARARGVLEQVRSVNPELTQDHLYTLYREGENVRFGVMTHAKPFTGDELTWHEYMRPAFDEGRVTASPLYSDRYGQWISAFAPIFNSAGAVVGVLEVDQPASKYFQAYERVKWMTAGIAGAALGLGSLLGVLVINRVVLRPMRAVRQGMLALVRQDFTHRVRLASRDEFEELGHLLNDLSRQLNAARQVARNFVPQELPTPLGWSISACTLPCEATAGDYFDAFTLPSGDTAILVADVTGHGLGPSLHMSACRSALRALASTGLAPAELLARLDALLQEDLREGMFITLFYATLSKDGVVTFCNAGHGPALVSRMGMGGEVVEGVRVLTSHRAPLGVPWEVGADEEAQTVLTLEPGERLLLCSDGVPEAMDAAGRQLGSECLTPLLLDRSATPESVVAAVRGEVERHCKGSAPRDDITILCVERTTILDGEYLTQNENSRYSPAHQGVF